MYFLWTPKESTKERRRYFRGAGHGQGATRPLEPQICRSRTGGAKKSSRHIFLRPAHPLPSYGSADKFYGSLVFTRLILSYGWFVGNGLDRSGRFAAIANFPGGVGSPRPTGQQKHLAVGAGHAPPATVCYNQYNGLTCRGGIYAARCNHPYIATQRLNRTGRIYASPTNLPEIANYRGKLYCIKCVRAADTPHLLSLISYLLSKKISPITRGNTVCH